MNDLGFTHRYIPAPRPPTARVLLLLHGTGGDEDDLLSLGRELDPDAALLSPRGKVSENGSPRFFRRFAEGVFDEEDVIRRAHELADFVSAAVEAYELPVGNITAVGYSNGANIATAVLFLRPEILAGAILFRAMVPLTDPALPDLSGRRIFLSAGAQDPIVPRRNVEQLVALLKKAGAEVISKVQPAGHGLIAADLDGAKDWLRSA